MKTLPSADVLIIGGGWTGLLMAKELGSRTPLSIVVLERGPPAQTADYANGMDELDYFIRFHMMQDPSQRNGHVSPRRQRARSPHPPVRRFPSRHRRRRHRRTLGSGRTRVFSPIVSRCSPRPSNDTAKRNCPKATRSRIGASPTTNSSRTTRARSAKSGVSGKAGNLNGKKIEGGNIFEGWRSDGISDAADQSALFSQLFATRRNRSAIIPYTNAHRGHQRGVHQSRRRHAPAAAPSADSANARLA